MVSQMFSSVYPFCCHFPVALCVCVIVFQIMVMISSELTHCGLVIYSIDTGERLELHLSLLTHQSHVLTHSLLHHRHSFISMTHKYLLIHPFIILHISSLGTMPPSHTTHPPSIPHPPSFSHHPSITLLNADSP